MLLETRIYTYQTEVLDEIGSPVHWAGEKVHQTKTKSGQWRDTESLRCLAHSTELCRKRPITCKCDHCETYRKATSSNSNL